MVSSDCGPSAGRKTLAREFDFAPELEEQLRQSAPVLPASLKSRTLAHCASRALVQQQRNQRLQRQMTWAVVGVLAMQSLTLFVVDTQNTRLVQGNSAPSPAVPISLAEINELWYRRSRQLAHLMEPSKLG
jgi:hypothetical protein